MLVGGGRPADEQQHSSPRADAGFWRARTRIPGVAGQLRGKEGESAGLLFYLMLLCAGCMHRVMIVRTRSPHAAAMHASSVGAMADGHVHVDADELEVFKN